MTWGGGEFGASDLTTVFGFWWRITKFWVGLLQGKRLHRMEMSSIFLATEEAGFCEGWGIVP